MLSLMVTVVFLVVLSAVALLMLQKGYKIRS